MSEQAIHFSQPAMATLFEGWLFGQNKNHLRAVSQLLKEEILRLERLLSRFDRQAELYRVNRDAFSRPVKVERELLNVLTDALKWYDRTNGYFDISVNSLSGSEMRLPNALVLNQKNSSVQFLHSDLKLDLGGYCKGYALDCLAEILEEYRVGNAILHGGKSSVLAIGEHPKTRQWCLDISGHEAKLPAGGFSYSGVFDPGTLKASDIFNPHSGDRLTQPEFCAVTSPNALTAEVLSTAILCMDTDARSDFINNLPNLIQVQLEATTVS